jgi:hypothetical protein
MEETRRKFLQFLGLSAGATLVSSSALAEVLKQEEIHKLNPEQQKFMVQYGKWMDEFIEVIRIKKNNPADIPNNKKMMSLTDQAEIWKPQLTEFMKDKTFALVYHASIERMKKEI